MYHLKDTSLKVPDNNLHFMESGALMMAIHVLLEVTCSLGSLRPSNLANDWGLKPLWTWVPHISSESG